VTTMSWFRSRLRWGACLALLALAFQLAVSFGHVHLAHIASAAVGATPVANTQASDDGVTAPSKPAGREDVADALCPICALIHLAGALVPAEMPPLPLRSHFGSLRREAAAAFDLTAAQGALFRARAPPLT
jgi:ABC-type branched-subunit amino acid transport system permease subunit